MTATNNNKKAAKTAAKRNRPTVKAMDALNQANQDMAAQLAELAAKLEAALTAPAPVEAEEVVIAGLSDTATVIQVVGNRDTHYAAATENRASATVGARGVAVVRPAPKSGGLAHRRAAAAMLALKLVTGDCVTGRDAEAIASAYQDANGFAMMPSSVGPALAKWADAGWLQREGAGAGTRGNGYTVTDAMWEGLPVANRPSVWA